MFGLESRVLESVTLPGGSALAEKYLFGFVCQAQCVVDSTGGLARPIRDLIKQKNVSCLVHLAQKQRNVLPLFWRDVISLAPDGLAERYPVLLNLQKIGELPRTIG